MKLVPNADRAWRWFSMHAMVLAGAVQGAWLMLPPDLAARAPEWTVSAATAAILLLGIAGRLVDQSDA